MKKFAIIFLALFAVISFTACSNQEADPEVPIASPTDDGPQPANVTGTGGGAAPAPTNSGGSQAASTE